MSGADTAYSQEAVKAVRKAYRNRVGFDKQPIISTPDRVIVGTTLEDIAETLYSKDHPVLSYRTGKDNEIRFQTMDDDVKGRLRPISTPYLDNTAINQTIFKDDDRVFPNQSPSQYFVTCDPNSAEGAAFYIPCLHGNPVRPGADATSARWQNFAWAVASLLALRQLHFATTQYVVYKDNRNQTAVYPVVLNPAQSQERSDCSSGFSNSCGSTHPPPVVPAASG